MVHQLNSQQQKQVSAYVRKWIESSRRTRPTDREKAVEAVRAIYEKVLKTAPPKDIVVLSSPMACQRACNFTASAQLGARKTWEQFFRKLDRQLDLSLAREVAIPLYGEFYHPLRNQFGGALENHDLQLRHHLESQNLVHFDMGWSGLSYSLLSRCGFNDYLLQEVFPEKKKRFQLFEECLPHLQEIHQGWFFKDVAFLSDFPETVKPEPQWKGYTEADPALVYRDGFTLWPWLALREIEAHSGLGESAKELEQGGSNTLALWKA